mgnify:CR=1 FL=1
MRREEVRVLKQEIQLSRAQGQRRDLAQLGGVHKRVHNRANLVLKRSVKARM